jgi:putative nucleotidyltransferase with HDIG domain
MAYTQRSQDTQNIVPELSIALIQVKQQKHFAPLLALIESASPATAKHSKGVAAVARTLGVEMGCGEETAELLALAGMLHDIGKLTIPDHVLNKAGSLSSVEKQVMRSHVDMTFHILRAASITAPVLRWCAFHHERLNGTGYPFGIHADVLDQGSRIMSIADVFVALTENRIYRTGMTVHEAVAAMSYMVANGNLDTHIFEPLKTDPNRFDDTRRLAQRLSGSRFRAA